jgi:Lrp/AsnC family transcriptional regulator for asnA, asnC and gidA
VEARKLRPVDLRIIHSLRLDPRSSVAKIAARWDLPESTVRFRMNRLVESGILEFAVVTNPLQFGYHIWVMINIQTEMPKIRSVARDLAATPEVYFVGITTGGYDIFAAAVFRSNHELLDFITRRLAKIPGIIRTSTSTILDLVKRGLAYGVPDTLPNGHEGKAATRRNSGPTRRRRRQPSHRHG